MKKIKLPCGWTAYQTTLEETKKWGGMGICDFCNKFCPDGGFLVPVLNSWLCSECFEEYKKRAKYYPEDAAFEQHAIEYFEKIVPVEE